MSSEIYDVIITGAGPAGLTAAIYAARAELKLLLLEKGMIEGGQIINTTEVDNYPGLYHVEGFELGMKFREHANSLGVESTEGTVSGIRLLEDGKTKEVVTAEGKSYFAKSVIIAGGAKHRALGVSGEEKFMGNGVSYCATCDGAFFKGKTVAVNGGGDVALEDALFLAGLCEKVYLIHRRDEFRAAKVLVTQVKNNPKIEIITPATVKEIKGTKSVESILIETLGSGETKELAVSAIFVAIGMLPETDYLKGFLELDQTGYIVAGEDTKTNIEGIFAAGDIRTKELRQVVTAAADGAVAVTGVEKYLRSL